MLLQTMNRLALSVFLCAMISGRCQASFVVEQESHVENSEVQLFDYQRPINAWYDQYVSVLPYEQKQMIRSVLLWMITYTAFNTSIRHLISVGTGFAAAAQRAMSQNKESDHYIEKAQYAFGEAQKIRAAERSAHLQMNELLQNIEANPDLDAAAQALEMVRINVQDLLTQFINQDAISISASLNKALDATNSISEDACKNIEQSIKDTIYHEFTPAETILEVSIQGYYQYALAIEKLIYQSKIFRNSINAAQSFAKNLVKLYFNKIDAEISTIVAQDLSDETNRIQSENLDLIDSQR